MANKMGLSKLAERGINKLKEKASEKKHEVAEKVNPMSQTNKNARKERHEQRSEDERAEREAYRKEVIRQREERGKRSARREYGSPAPKPKSSYGRSTPKSHTIFQPPTDPFFGNLLGPSRKAKPKVPTKTTTVKTSDGKTITIREQIKEEQKKEDKQKYYFKDPFEF